MAYSCHEQVRRSLDMPVSLRHLFDPFSQSQTRETERVAAEQTGTPLGMCTMPEGGLEELEAGCTTWLASQPWISLWNPAVAQYLDGRLISLWKGDLGCPLGVGR